MLVRINSAASGIREYLETGRKKGREYDRDLIDERLPLAGDIELLDAVIDTIETKQEGDSRYLHITLGFAEQFTNAAECGPGQINPAKLRAIVEAYRDHLMVAYDSSEYVFYAEAHIPKVSHELNAVSGDYESRLPHVHIVIPYRNLETDRYLNPFGYLKDMSVPDSIQELINQDFSLVSPKHSRRDPSAPQHPLGKHADKFEGQSPKQIRDYLKALVADGQISTFNELIEAALPIGVVTVRNGKDGDYLNIKPDWATRGINLKGLDRQTFDASAQKLKATIRPEARQVVADWRDRGAFEARYLTSLRMKKAYAAMSPDDRSDFLDARRAETAQRLAYWDRTTDQQIVDAAGDIVSKLVERVASEGVPLPYSKLLADRIELLIKEIKNGRPERDFSADVSDQRDDDPDLHSAAGNVPDLGTNLRSHGSAQPGRYRKEASKGSRATGAGLGKDSRQARTLTDSELKANSDPILVLRVARQRYGIDTAAYAVATGRDGTPRIVHNAKQYNLGDFFTKHLGKTWAEARSVLQSTHQPERLRTDDRTSNTDQSASSEHAEFVRLAGKALSRASALAKDTQRTARFFEYRNLGVALEATLRRLREDRPNPSTPLSIEETIDRAGAALARAAVMASDKDALKAAFQHRQEAISLSAALRRLAVDQSRKPTRSKTVMDAILESTRKTSLPVDKLKSETNPAILLTAAQRLYGIDPAEYTITTGADRSPRIVHNHKQYNLADFLTKHLRRPWAEAQDLLRDCYHATNSDALPPPDNHLWRQFNQWRKAAFEALSKQRTVESQAFRTRVLATRAEYENRKLSASSQRGAMRVTAMAQARAEQFISQQQIAAERAIAKQRNRIPPRNAHYREFLMQMAAGGDTTALAELRRMAPHEHDQAAKVTSAQSKAVFPLPTYSVDARGGVTYSTKAGAIVRDAVQGVTVLKAETSAYDAALRVSIARYGRTLMLTGDSRFVANMLEAAKRSGLELTLRDASRPNAAPIVLPGRHQHPSRN